MRMFVIVALLGLATGLGASSNPDGSAWTPALHGWAAYFQGYTRQKATLSHPPFVPTQVIATAGDSPYTGLRLELPLGRAVTLSGDYEGGTRSYDYDFSEGPYHWVDHVSEPWSQGSVGLKLYSQGFVAEEAAEWGVNANPDGRLWFPSLGLQLISAAFRPHEEDKDVPTGIVFGSYDDRHDYRQFEGSLGLPMLGALSGRFWYGRDLWRQIYFSARPGASFEDGGDQSWWGLGLQGWLNQDGGDASRGWNPDGKEDSVKLSLSYLQFYAAERRLEQQWELRAYYILSSWCTARLGLDFEGLETLPYSSTASTSVSSQTEGRFRVGAGLALSLYLPGTLPRPFKAAPAAEPTPEAKPTPQPQSQDLKNEGREAIQDLMRDQRDRHRIW